MPFNEISKPSGLSKFRPIVFVFVAIFQMLFYGNSYGQLTISGVDLPANLSFENQDLVLNGGGLREKFFIDLYVGGLYLTETGNNDTEIIENNEPMAVRLSIVSGLITSEKMINATLEGFEKSTKGNTSPIEDRIQMFIDVFEKSEIQEGDVYDIFYSPDKGTIIYKNNQIQSTIKGLDFKKALFGIWLCDEPADQDLKEGMLGN